MNNEMGIKLFNDYWQIDNLKLLNWGAYDGGPYVIDFAKRDTGSLTMITGNSGTGKSTVIDAITVLLFKAGLKLNSASSDGAVKQENRRTIASYALGAIEKKGSDNGPRYIEYFRGKDDDGNSVPVWSAISVTFSNEARGSLTLAGFFYVPAGSRENIDCTKIWSVSSQEMALEKASTVADERFSRASIRSVFPNASVVSDNKEDMRREYHRVVGINNASEQLLYRLLTGTSVNNVNDIYQKIVLTSPETIDIAKQIITNFDEAKNSIEQLNQTLKKKEVFDQIRNAYKIYLEKKQDYLPYSDLFANDTKTMNGAVNDWFYITVNETLSKQINELLNSKILEETELRNLNNKYNEADTELEALRAAYNSNGGQRLESAEREVRNKEEILTKAKALAESAEQAFLNCGKKIPETETAWNNEIDSLKEKCKNYKDRLDADRDRLYEIAQQQKVATSQLEDANEALQRALRLKTRITGDMDKARKAISNASGIPKERLPYACELFDLKEEEEKWRPAANLALAGISRMMLVDSADKEIFDQALAGLKPKDLGIRLSYKEITNKESGREARVNSDSLLSKLVFKKSEKAAFVEFLIDDLDITCGERGDVDGGNTLRIDGLLTASSGGQHGYRTHEIPDVIGYVDEKVIDRLTENIRQMEDEKNKLSSAHQKLKTAIETLEGEGALFDSIKGIRFDAIDTATAELLLQQAKNIVSELKANNNLEQLKNKIEEADDRRLKLNTEKSNCEKRCKKIADRISVISDYLQTVIIKNTDKPTGLSLESDGVLREAYKDVLKGIEFTFESINKLNEMMLQVKRQFENVIITNARKLANELNVQKNQVESQMHVAHEFYAATTPEIEYIGTSIEDIDAYLSVDVSSTKKTLVDIYTNAIFRLANSFETYINQRKDYEKEVMRTFEKLNEILENYPFNENGDALRLKPSFHWINSGFKSIKKMTETLANLHFQEGMTGLREWNTEKLESLFDDIEKAVSYFRDDGNDASKCSDIRKLLNVDVMVEDGSIIEADADNNGGKFEKVKAFVLSSALFYTLNTEADNRPKFAPLFLDEAFIKSDVSTTQISLGAMLGFGFQIFLSCPDSKQAPILPLSDLAWIITRKSGHSPATPNRVELVDGKIVIR